MPDTKFLPGPWVFSNGNLIRVSKSIGSSSICVCGVHRIGRHVGSPTVANEVAVANGRLIAAAPDLYAALNHLAAEVALLAGAGVELSADMARAIDGAVAVLVKARGEG